MKTPTDKQIKQFLLAKVQEIHMSGKDVILNWVYRAPVSIMDGEVVIPLHHPAKPWSALDKQFFRTEFFQNRDGTIYPYTLEDIGSLFSVNITLNDY